MDAKFQSAKTQFEKLKADLTDPAVVNNPEKLKSISQEYSRLEPIAKKIDELERTERQLAEAQAAILAGDDSELLTIAQDEIAGLSELKRSLESEISEDLKPRNPLNRKKRPRPHLRGHGGGFARSRGN